MIYIISGTTDSSSTFISTGWSIGHNLISSIGNYKSGNYICWQLSPKKASLNIEQQRITQLRTLNLVQQLSWIVSQSECWKKDHHKYKTVKVQWIETHNRYRDNIVMKRVTPARCLIHMGIIPLTWHASIMQGILYEIVTNLNYPNKKTIENWRL